MSAPQAPAVAKGPVSLEVATLRIFSTTGDPVGLGFLVTRELALTCAHVVASALGLEDDAEPALGASIGLDLPLLAQPGQDVSALTATVEEWIPEQSSGAGDVAVLRLSKPLQAAGPVRLITAPDVWNHKARAFGFPDGHPAGVWHAGLLRARQANNWVQMNHDPTAGGHPVSRGFSGAPVWDDTLGAVVGMLTAAEIGTPPVSYLIPTERLVAAWPDLPCQKVIDLTGPTAFVRNLARLVTRWRTRRRLLFGVLLGTVLAGSVLTVLAVMFATNKTPPKPPVSKPSPVQHSTVPPSTFTLSGTLTIKISSSESGNAPLIATTAQGCEGTGPYSDMSSGTAVVITDPEGRQVAVGVLQFGRSAAGNSNTCVMPFSASDVPRGLPSYSITISHRGTQVFTPSKAQAGVRLGIGQ